MTGARVLRTVIVAVMLAQALLAGQAHGYEATGTVVVGPDEIILDARETPASLTLPVSPRDGVVANGYRFTAWVLVEGGSLSFTLLDAGLGESLAPTLVVTRESLSAGSVSLELAPGQPFLLRLEYYNNGSMIVYVYDREGDHVQASYNAGRVGPWTGRTVVLNVAATGGVVVLESPRYSPISYAPRLLQGLPGPRGIAPSQIVAGEGCYAEYYRIPNTVALRGVDGSLVAELNLTPFNFTPRSGLQLLDAHCRGDQALVLFKASQFEEGDPQPVYPYLLAVDGALRRLDPLQGYTSLRLLGPGWVYGEKRGERVLHRVGGDTVTLDPALGSLVEAGGSGSVGAALFQEGLVIALGGSISVLWVEGEGLTVSGGLVAVSTGESLMILDTERWAWANYTLPGTITLLGPTDNSTVLAVVGGGNGSTVYVAGPGGVLEGPTHPGAALLGVEGLSGSVWSLAERWNGSTLELGVARGGELVWSREFHGVAPTDLVVRGRGLTVLLGLLYGPIFEATLEGLVVAGNYIPPGQVSLEDLYYTTGQGVARVRLVESSVVGAAWVLVDSYAPDGGLARNVSSGKIRLSGHRVLPRVGDQLRIVSLAGVSGESLHLGVTTIDLASASIAERVLALELPGLHGEITGASLGYTVEGGTIPLVVEAGGSVTVALASLADGSVSTLINVTGLAEGLGVELGEVAAVWMGNATLLAFEGASGGWTDLYLAWTDSNGVRALRNLSSLVLEALQGVAPGLNLSLPEGGLEGFEAGITSVAVGGIEGDTVAGIAGRAYITLGNTVRLDFLIQPGARPGMVNLSWTTSSYIMSLRGVEGGLLALYTGAGGPHHRIVAVPGLRVYTVEEGELLGPTILYGQEPPTRSGLCSHLPCYVVEELWGERGSIVPLPFTLDGVKGALIYAQGVPSAVTLNEGSKERWVVVDPGRLEIRTHCPAEEGVKAVILSPGGGTVVEATCGEPIGIPEDARFIRVIIHRDPRYAYEWGGHEELTIVPATPYNRDPGNHVERDGGTLYALAGAPVRFPLAAQGETTPLVIVDGAPIGYTSTLTLQEPGSYNVSLVYTSPLGVVESVWTFRVIVYPTSYTLQTPLPTWPGAPEAPPNQTQPPPGETTPGENTTTPPPPETSPPPGQTTSPPGQQQTTTPPEGETTQPPQQRPPQTVTTPSITGRGGPGMGKIVIVALALLTATTILYLLAHTRKQAKQP